MKTQLTILDDASTTWEITEPVSGMKPVLTLLMRLLWSAALALPAFGAQAGVVFTNLYSFTGGNDGANPLAGLVQGSDGNFYGTTSQGGTNDLGTVFKISTNGALTSLYSFIGLRDGEGPNGLVQGSDGNFYGTTFGAGSNDNGTVFKISTNGALATLYLFGSVQGTNGSPLDGANPLAGLAQGSDGDFYGTTRYGGTNGGNGTVFKISTNGVLTSLHSFTGTNDGANPQAALVQGRDGNFYGTTYYGGTNGGNGTVFKISTNGALTTLYRFGTVTDTNLDALDGAEPSAALVQGRDGNLYGTTETGGTKGLVFSGYGTVFKISTNGALTSLYSFTGGKDGDLPDAGLVQGSDGNLYGTASYGGTNLDVGGYGTVFKISTNGVLTSLHSFTGTNDGANPEAGLVQGRDGNFYGTTSAGGPGGAGTVFRLSTGPAAPVFQAVTLTNAKLSLTWSTAAGGMYQLQYNSNLSSTNWTNLGSVATAAGATLGAMDSVTNGPRRFYRVVLLP
jgi:uncharacterized repeat protein (TIGR03803 family)